MTMTFRQVLARPWMPADYGALQYTWLLSLGYLFWKFYYVTPGVAEAVLLALTIILFVPLYCASFWPRGWRVGACVAATCLIGAAWAPWNPGAACFFIFACAMCARIPGTARPVCAMLGVIAVGAVVALLIPQMQMVFLLPILMAGMPVGLSCIMDARLRTSRTLLMRKQEEVEHMARIAERERISRDLHDLLGHSLSMIALKAELARKLARRDLAACEREIADIETNARQALAEVRAAVTGFRHSGLVALAVREAVTNIVRHAGASRCTLSLVREQQDGQTHAVLRVLDNGKLRSTDGLQQGNGLAGMRERVAALGGRLSLQAGAGLALELHVPAGASA